MELSEGAKIGIAAFGRKTAKSGGGLKKVSADNTKKMITGYKEKSEYISKNGVTSTVYLMDCMEGMRGYADNHFDLAVVDPPYGLGKRTTDGGGTNSQIKFMEDIRRSNWDDAIPTPEYFAELKRVSKNQIIWGGNYFPLPPTRTIICWEKMVMIPTMSQIEIAWTSFDSPARIVKVNNTDKNRFHPTQKPAKLYDWIFNKYAKPTDTILDTHLGSGSSRIAAERAGLNFIGFELDADYYHAQEKRFKNHVSQLTLF
jgi:site-specific DNA-methyltransferase (adenine-specific)